MSQPGAGPPTEPAVPKSHLPKPKRRPIKTRPLPKERLPDVLLPAMKIESNAEEPSEHEAPEPPPTSRRIASAPTARATAQPNRRFRTLLLVLVGATLLAVVGVVAGTLFRRDVAPGMLSSASPFGSPTTSSTAPLASVSVSEECGNSFLFAATHRGEPGAEEFLTRTTQLCMTSDEWVTGLKRHPAAAGLADPAEASIATLQALCANPALKANAACRDATNTKP